MPTEESRQNRKFSLFATIAPEIPKSGSGLPKRENGENTDDRATDPIAVTSEKGGKNLPPLPLVRNDLDEYGLDPYEFRIYAHVVRRTGGKLEGECFAKQKKVAEICKMSVRKVQYALKTLCEAGLLVKEERKGRTDVYRLTPTSHWKPKEELAQIRQNVKASKSDPDSNSDEENE